VAALLLLCLAAVPLAVLAVNVPDALLALGCLFVATYCAWLAVTRRGALRLVALAGIVLALAGLGLTAWDHRIELTATVVALVLFGLLARAAVRGASARAGSRPVPPARHLVLVINPVQASEPVPLGLEGEAVRMAPPLRFVCRPWALRVRLPARARGVSPAGAAVSLSRRDLERLIRIAAGR
jgi:hypothetical protein